MIIKILSYLIIVVGAILVLLQTIIIGSGEFIDYIVQWFRALTTTIILGFIIGFIPYLILKKYGKEAKLIVFSTSFLLVSIFTLMGSLFNMTK